MSLTLQQRHTRLLFGRMLLILVAASGLFWMLMRLQAAHMQQKLLELKQLNVAAALRANPGAPRSMPGEYQVDATAPTSGLDQQRDTVLFHAGRKEHLPFAMLTRPIDLGGSKGYLTTFVSSEEISHLIIKVFAAEAGILALLFGAILWINRRSAGVLWAPFRQTLARLYAYDITRRAGLSLPQQTGTREFDELNKAVSDLVVRADQAYHNQKAFVENASHEMQTPLTIIRSKLELLASQPQLTPGQASLLADISEASERMSRMNRNLLLLAKIENNQFPEKSALRVDLVLDRLLREYAGAYEEAMPTLTVSFEPVMLTGSATLFDMLLGNLVRNAVLHNIPGGHMAVSLTQEQLVIQNSGLPPALPPDLFFERFRKGSDGSRSTGLGLAIARQICELYQFRIALTYQDGLYTCTVDFTGVAG